MEFEFLTLVLKDKGEIEAIIDEEFMPFITEERQQRMMQGVKILTKEFAEIASELAQLVEGEE